METVMNLVSETGVWITESEFVDPNGQISKATGETSITINGKSKITNHSYVEMGGKTLVNDYEIHITENNRYPFQSLNPTLGIQKGYFDIDRNVIYSRFEIENTVLNGYEIIIRNEDICTAYGALYNNTELINTWTAILRKKNDSITHRN